jgi:hypothetical protein
MAGWIKLHRTLKDWEWYSDIIATRVLIHLLLSVNYEPKNWQGINIKAGQLVMSWASLSKNCGISVSQARTAIEKAKDSGEIAIQVTNRFQIVTLLKWDQMQDSETESRNPFDSKIADKSQTNRKPVSRQIATTKETNKLINKEINISVLQKFDFKNSLKNLGVENEVINEWLEVRKNKRATNTQTAFKKIALQIEKSKITANEFIIIAVENSWSGINHKWLENLEKNGAKQKYSSLSKKAVVYKRSDAIAYAQTLYN